MRDIKVSFDKIERVLGFKAQISVEDGIREMAETVASGLWNERHVLPHKANTGD
jgi:nucleoside-diphosphate-sugar epimerase